MADPKTETTSQLQEVWDVIKDAIVFFMVSIYYILEAIFWTLLPKALRPVKDVNGDVVLITGGSGGVGRLLAAGFAKLGCKVVIWDVSQEGIDQTCLELKEQGYKVYGYVFDVSNKSLVYSMAEDVKQNIGNVDILINNAAIVYGATLLKLPDSAIEKTYNVNILSHYWTVKAFLPDMIANRKGHIVTMGSVAGLLGTYLCTDYSATKFAAVGFHESLFTELRAHGHNYIHTTLVCPYYINTGMFNGVKPRILPMLEPSYVAESVVESVLKNEVNCTLPGNVRFLLPLKCLLPAKMCWELMHRVIQGPQSMMMFKGRPKIAAG